MVHEGGTPSLVISCTADWTGGEIAVDGRELDQHAWATLEEAKEYELIDGIWDELAMAEQKRSGKKEEWKRF